MLRIQGLRKSYGDRVAVEGLDLEAAAGEITALLGPNGAGKSTTVHCVVGLLRPDAGTIVVDDVDALARPMAARRRIGYVPEVARIHDALTPMEYLQLKGRLFDLDEDRIARGAARLLDGLGLGDRVDQPMAAFSKGMTQKVCLAAGLLTDPTVLVLDEPLSGLDVETAMVVKELMREFARRGGSVLYCSHMLDVVETVAHRIIVLDKGARRASGTLAELRQEAGGGDQRLEELFRSLTASSDPVAKARAILGGNA